jgi:hypothetical protein
MFASARWRGSIHDFFPRPGGVVTQDAAENERHAQVEREDGDQNGREGQVIHRDLRLNLQEGYEQRICGE